MTARVVIGLGSNIGSREEHLARAREALERTGVRLTALSPVVETEPVGPPQERFLNQVVIGETSLEPRELLDALKAVERELGRTPGERWGPRVIDLDILDHGGLCLETPDLTLPHPEIARREFVLHPWSCVAPADLVPDGRGGKRRVDELLQELRSESSLAARGAVVQGRP